MDGLVESAAPVESPAVAGQASRLGRRRVGPLVADGLRMFVAGASGDDVYRFDLSTAWDLGTATQTTTLDVAGQDTAPTGVVFSPDGLVMLVVGTGGDSVYRYDLSTAWDITTAAHVSTLDVSAQDTAPTGLFISPDGSMLFVVGEASDVVYRYDLSAAFDLSTAVHVSTLDVSGQDLRPAGLFLRVDGTMLFHTGFDSDAVHAYDLATPWDLASAVFSASLDISGFENVPNELFISPDGVMLFVVGSGGDNVYRFDLATAWDVTTGVHVATLFVGGVDTAPTGLWFS